MTRLNADQTNIVIRKAARELLIVADGKSIKSYRTAVGYTPLGNKQAEGDGRTPEGEFYVFTKNEQSKYHLSLGISYPGVEDAKRGLAEGLITPEEYDAILTAVAEGKKPPQKTALGGEIYIHGGGSEKDWTEGCIAVADEEMDEIFAAVSVGTRVTILP